VQLLISIALGRKIVVTFLPCSVNYKSGPHPASKEQKCSLNLVLNFMKYFAQPVLLMFIAATAVGSPLRKEQVAADAKWVVHIDVDKLRSTTVGGVLKQLLDAKIAPMSNQFGIDLDWNKVRSLTAYGTGYQAKPDFNGVVVINTDLDLQKALDGAIEKMSQENGETPPVQKTQKGDVMTYSIHGELFASLQPGKPALLSKSRESLRKAEAVLSGSAANLASTKTFSEFPSSPKGFFLVVAAEDFNLAEQFGEHGDDGEKGNPKAKILKLADGGRVMLGEEANQLLLDLSLKARASEVVTQMQQVIQGMIALASLSQSDNADLQQLAQSAKVSSAGNIVSLQLGYPADKAIEMVKSHINGGGDHKKRAENGEVRRKKHRAKSTAHPREEASDTDDK
jgi:hypothetical protein